MEKDILKKKKADLICMGRAIIADPHIVKKTIEDKEEDVLSKNFMDFIQESWSEREDISKRIVEEYILELKNKSLCCNSIEIFLCFLIEYIIRNNETWR